MALFWAGIVYETPRMSSLVNTKKKMPATYQDDPARQKKRVQSVVMIFQTRRNGMMLDVAAGDKGRPLQKMGTETRSCETLISLHAGSSAVEPCRRTKPVFYSERGGGWKVNSYRYRHPT